MKLSVFIIDTVSAVFPVKHLRPQHRREFLRDLGSYFKAAARDTRSDKGEQIFQALPNSAHIFRAVFAAMTLTRFFADLILGMVTPPLQKRLYF